MVEENVSHQLDELAMARTRLSGAHILLVEDNPFNQLVVTDLLKIVGATVVAADNGKKALEQLSSAQFDLVIMDTQMPVMDGYETTRQIRMEPSLANLRIIAMTANVTDEDRRRCYSAGMDDFMSKPIDPDQMYMILAKWLPKPIVGDVKYHSIIEKQDVSELEPEPVDMSVLNKAFHHDGDLVSKFANKFIQVANETLLEMKAAKIKHDLATLGGLGHKLKSSARTIGAIGFADLCDRLEAASKNNNWPEAQTLMTQIPLLLERVTQQLEQEIGDKDTR